MNAHQMEAETLTMTEDRGYHLVIDQPPKTKAGRIALERRLWFLEQVIRAALELDGPLTITIGGVDFRREPICSFGPAGIVLVTRAAQLEAE